MCYFADDRAPRLPVFAGRLKVFHSATVTFISPSDPSGIGSMRREQIRAMPTWHRGPARYDCVFASTNDTVEGMLSMEVARVLSFFSFVYTNGHNYSCALVHWFDCCRALLSSRLGSRPSEAF